MIHEFTRTLNVETPQGYGWAIYVSVQSGFANDIWCVALEDGGHIRHYRSDQLTMLRNGTLDITNAGEKFSVPAKDAKSTEGGSK
jgi:hypothetical protein